MQYEQDDADDENNMKETSGHVEREQSQKPHYNQNRSDRC